MPSLRHDCLRKLAIHIPVQEEVLDFNARHYVGFPIGLAVVRGLAHSDVALIGACRHVSLGDVQDVRLFTLTEVTSPAFAPSNFTRILASWCRKVKVMFSVW